ncbi:MAG: glycosyl hydrolase family 18 protein [Bacteroidota bacterium]
MRQEKEASINVFIAYSRKDVDYLNQLRTYLQPLQRNRTIQIWYDGEIAPGATWEAEIKRHLYDADIVLLLVSADSLASNYFYDQEMAAAMQRHRDHQTIVVPIILRDCAWELTDLQQFQALPKDGLPIDKWDSESSAYANVVRGLYKSIDQVKERKARLGSQTEQGLNQTSPKVERKPSQKERKSQKKLLRLGLPMLALILFFFIARQFTGGTSDSPIHARDAKESKTSAIDLPAKAQHVVWGTVPHWMLRSFQQHDYTHFTHLAFFSYDLDPDTGNNTDEQMMEQLKAFVEQQNAKEKKQKLLLTISVRSSEALNIFLQNKGLQQEHLIDNVTALIRQLKLSGVSLAFEDLPNAQGPALLAFIRAFSTQLKLISPQQILSLKLPHDFETEGNYPNLSGISDQIDFFILNGYEYYNRSSETAGPMSPLESPENAPSLVSTIKPLLQKDISPTKFIVELPYFGSLWHCTEDAIKSENCTFKEYLIYRNLINRYDSNRPPQRDLLSQSAYFSRKIEDQTYELLWFEDPISLKSKYAWIKQQGLGGVAIWALGYDGGHPDLKAVLEASFNPIPN